MGAVISIACQVAAEVTTILWDNSTYMLECGGWLQEEATGEAAGLPRGKQYRCVLGRAVHGLAWQNRSRVHMVSVYLLLVKEPSSAPVVCRHVGSDLTTVFADQFSSAWEFAGGYDVRSHVDATLLRWAGGVVCLAVGVVARHTEQHSPTAKCGALQLRVRGGVSTSTCCKGSVAACCTPTISGSPFPPLPTCMPQVAEGLSSLLWASPQPHWRLSPLH